MSAPTNATAIAPPDRGHDAREELRARIFALAYPSTLLTRELGEELLRETCELGDADLSSDLIMTLNGRGALRLARELAAKALVRFPKSDSLLIVSRLVQPPRVTRVPGVAPRPDRRPDFEWLKAHAEEYRGEWLVLCQGRLWGHSPSLATAEEQARQAGLEHPPLVYRVSDLDEPHAA